MIAALALSLTIGLVPQAAADAAAPSPNVVFILCDDLGWGDLGVLHQNARAGDKRIQTPHIDRMAARGVVLQQHYCPAAVCAPSRASLLNGVHQGHATIRDNQFDKALEDSHTLPSVLRAAGYRTALIGKYGLQGKGKDAASWPAYPTKRGFDEFYGYIRHRDGHSHYPAHVTEARGKMQVWDQGREVSAGLEGCYTTDLFTARAKRFLVERASDESKAPFFLMLAYDTPHAALHVPTQAYPEGLGVRGGLQWVGRRGEMINTARGGEVDGWLLPEVADQDWTDGAKRFATMVRRIDDCVGDLLQTLADLELFDNTLIVLTSDNGPHKEAYTKGRRYDASEFDSYGPFDGIKRDAWEGGIRVPTVVLWPGAVPAGHVDREPSQFHDWMPTLCDVAGVLPPARSDGVSLLSRWRAPFEGEPSVVYVEYAGGGKTPGYDVFDASHRGRGRGQEQVVFLDGFKGIRVQVKSHDAPFEIYDVRTDPRESTNLAMTSDRFRALEHRMRDHVLRIRRPNRTAPRPYDGALVPAVRAADSPERQRNSTIGVRVMTYDGTWPWLPAFRPDAAAGSGVTPAIAAPPEGTSGALYSGFLDVPTSGDWRLELATDGEALLRLHGARIVEVSQGETTASAVGKVRLEKGRHPFRIYYRARNGNEAAAAPVLALRWASFDGPLEPVPTEALSH